MKTVCCRLDLGVTRIAGYTLYNENNHDFEETTPKEVKSLIMKGQVNGLKLENGEIVIATDIFNINNLMIKSAVGKYRQLYPTASIVSCMYALVRVIETDTETIYEIISNKCARFKFNTEQLKGLIDVGGYVSGVKLSNSGEIEACKGVTIDDRRSKSEQMDDSSNTEGNEVKPSLNGSIQETQISSVLKAEIKPDEAVIVNETASNEKADSLEVVFDTLEVNKLTSEFAIKADDENLNTSNIKEGEGAKPLEEHIDKKDIGSPRKTKRK